MFMSRLCPVPIGLGRMLRWDSVVIVMLGFAPAGNGPLTGCSAASCAPTGAQITSEAKTIDKAKVDSIFLVAFFINIFFPLHFIAELRRKPRQSVV